MRKTTTNQSCSGDDDPDEVVRRRDEALRRALNTPPEPRPSKRMTAKPGPGQKANSRLSVGRK